MINYDQYVQCLIKWSIFDDLSSTNKQFPKGGSALCSICWTEETNVYWKQYELKEKEYISLITLFIFSVNKKN